MVKATKHKILHTQLHMNKVFVVCLLRGCQMTASFAMYVIIIVLVYEGE